VSVDIIKPGTPNLKELLKPSVKPETSADTESVTKESGKKLDQQAPVTDDKSKVSEDSSSVKNDSSLSGKKENVKPGSIKKVETGNVFSKLFEGNNVIFGGLGLIGIAIIFLLILLLRKKKKNGKDAKN
jgi:LPXTG-motif cell wall-anchored protein